MSEEHQSIEGKFEISQQHLVDAFKRKLKTAAEDVLSDLYTDVANYAVSDAHTNFRNYLRDEMRESFIKEITEEHGIYSWAHSIRMEILKRNSKVLRNKIIEDLEAKIERLVQENNQLRERLFR